VADLEQAALWHRQIAALVAAADRAGVATEDLPAVRARLAAQVTDFTRAASLAGQPLPALQPTTSEIAAVTPALGDLSDAAAGQLLRTASATLDAADAALKTTGVSPTPVTVPARGPSGGATTTTTDTLVGPSAAPTTPTTPVQPTAPAPARAPKGIETWRHGPRNSLVYGACTLVLLVLQAALFYSVSETQLPLWSPVCLLVLPAFAWAAGWVLVGALFEPAAGTRLNRTPRLGAVVCFAPEVVVIAAIVVEVIRGIVTF
jgi:hypothetical protein